MQYGDNDVLTSDTMVTHPVLQQGALSLPFCSSNDSVKPLLKDNLDAISFAAGIG